MINDLKIKTINALVWSLIEIIGLQAVQSIIGIILARLLLPKEFGLIAMLLVFMTIGQTFVDSGFGLALIQKRDVTHRDECSIFYCNIVIGVLATGVLWLAAPLIAAFYNQPILVPLTEALSLNLVINSFGLIQFILMQKRLDFKAQTKVSLSASLISGAIGVTLAVNGFGVWSLVVQSLSSNLIRNALLWVFMPWRPAWTFSFGSLRPMFGFGSKLLISGLLTTVYDNLYVIVIGKLFSPAALGFYTRALNLQKLPSSVLSGIALRVTFPVFSVIQNDKPQLKRGVKKAIITMMTANFPIMVGLAIVADPLVRVLLTGKWLPCVPYLRLLCVAGVMYPLHAINVNVLRAQGRADLSLIISISKKVLTTIAILITWRWGITAMIYGQIVTSLLAYYLNAYYTGKFLSYPMYEQIVDILPSLGMAGLMGISVFAAGLLPFPNYWSMLLVQVAVGAGIYVSLCRLFRLSAFMEIWQAGWNKIAVSRAGTAG